MAAFIILLQKKIDEYFVYRLNFILWRVRNIFNLLLLFFLWNTIYTNDVEIAGYTKDMIFTYILIANFVYAVVVSSRTDQFGGDILNGNIINFLLKPTSIFSYIGSREVADKVLNTLFAIGEILLFVLIFQPPFIFQSNILALGSFIVFMLLGICISFLLGFSMALFAFWSTEIWAPRFIFFVVISLVAGTLFPLDILPDVWQAWLMVTPFPYLVYAPAKAYVFGLTPEMTYHFGIAILWCIGLYYIAVWQWQTGLKQFSFFGR